MKRVPVVLLAVLLAFGVVYAQNKNAKPEKAKPVVDCSNADDAKLTADVKARIAAAASLKDLSIDVSTTGAVVTLKGMAKKPTQKGTATRVVRAVKCVKSVDNQMTVEGAAEKKPAKAKNSNKM